jgi:hypothetical protein
METEIQNKVFEYIEAVAQKLGVASEYVFDLLVTQQIIEGITTLSVLVLFSLMSVASLVAGFKWMNRDGVTFNDDDFHPSFIFIIAGFVVSIILLVAFAVELGESVMQIINPRYYAVKEILNVFSK